MGRSRLSDQQELCRQQGTRAPLSTAPASAGGWRVAAAPRIAASGCASAGAGHLGLWAPEWMALAPITPL
jgi:hypothetical protein